MIQLILIPRWKRHSLVKKRPLCSASQAPERLALRQYFKQRVDWVRGNVNYFQWSVFHSFATEWLKQGKFKACLNCFSGFLKLVELSFLYSVIFPKQRMSPTMKTLNGRYIQRIRISLIKWIFFQLCEEVLYYFKLYLLWNWYDCPYPRSDSRVIPKNLKKKQTYLKISLFNISTSSSSIQRLTSSSRVGIGIILKIQVRSV